MKHFSGILAALSLAFLVLTSGNLPAQGCGGGPGGGPGGGDPPLLCGAECLAVAMDAAEACKDAGGDLMTCSRAFMDAMMECKRAAGCDMQRPPICGEECLTAARDAAKACHDAGGDSAACMTEVKNQLKACLEVAGCEVPIPPDMPPMCGMTCLKDAMAAARDRMREGGELMECAGAFRDALEACREAAGCGMVEEPPPPEEEGQILGLLLEETFVRGDANGDTLVDIADPIVVLLYLFLGKSAPACADSADADDDGTINIGDPIFILSVLFRGTGSLPAPFPAEGFDPTEDDVVCGLPSS
jgi:hypothetical protein